MKFSISNPDDKKYFRPEWQPLITAAFQELDGLEAITLHKRLSGYSVAQIWRVEVRVAKKINRTLSFAVKIASKPRMEDEFKRHKEYVSGGGLYGNPIRVEDRLYESEDGKWGLLKFPFAGDENSKTLLSYYDESSAANVTDILKKTLGYRSSQNDFSELTFYHKYYDRLLPVHFEFDGMNGYDENATPINGSDANENLKTIYESLTNNPKQCVRLESFRVEKLETFRVEKVEETVLTLYSEQPTGDDSFKVRIKYKLAKGQDTNQIPAVLFATNPKTRRDILEETARAILKTKVKDRIFTYGNNRNRLTYPNPIYYLTDTLLGTDTSLKCAVIHGDLNLQNILVLPGTPSTEPPPKYWLIDFADTGHGPVLLDFQWLEVNVILWMLAPAIKDAALNANIVVSFLKMLHSLEDELPPSLQKLAEPFAILRQIRLLARDHLKTDSRNHLKTDWSEYYHGLVLLLLGSLRFHKSIPTIDTSQLRVALLCAATTICWANLPIDLEKVSKEIQTATPPPPDDSGGRESDNVSEIHEAPGSPSPVISPVIPPPAIDKPSEKIFPRKKFGLHGSAQPGAMVKVKINQLRMVLVSGAVLLLFAVGAWFLLPEFAKIIIPPVVSHCDPLLPEIKIGIAINQIGDYARKDQTIAYEIARDYYNDNGGIDGGCIEVHVRDLESRTTKADTLYLENAFNGLINNDKVVAIIGPGLSQQASLINDLLREIETPVIGASVTREGIVCNNEYFGRVSAPGRWYVRVALGEAATKVNKATPRVAIAFADDDVFTKGESEVFIEYVEDTAGDYLLLEEDKYPYRIHDPNIDKDQALENIAGKIKTSDPDIVIISALLEDGKILLKKLRDAGYDKPIVGGNSFNTPYIFDECVECDDFDNLFIPQAYDNTITEPRIRQDFIALYTNFSNDPNNERRVPIYDRNPGQFAAQMFTAMQLIVESLREMSIKPEDLSGENDDGLRRLRQALQKKLFSDDNEDRDTVLGPLHLNNEGEVMQSEFYVAESVRNKDDNGQNLPGYHFAVAGRLSVDVKEEATDECVMSTPTPTSIPTSIPTSTLPLTPTVITIGIVVDTQGEQAEVGKDQVKGVEVAEKFLHEQNANYVLQIKRPWKDTTDDPLEATQAITSLVNEGVVAIVGPSLSKQAKAAAEVAEQQKVPVIGASTTADYVPQLGCYISRIAAPAAQVFKATLSAAHYISPTIRDIAIAYRNETDAYTISEAATFSETIAGLGLGFTSPFSDSYSITATEADFTALADRMVLFEPDLVFVAGDLEDGGKLIKQLRDKGYTGLIIGGDGFNSQNIQACGKTCDGIIVGQGYYKDADNPQNHKFVDEYHAKNGKESDPPPYAAQMFVAVQVIAEALKEIDKETPIKNFSLRELRMALNKKLLSGMTFDTPLSEISLALDGEVQQSTVYAAWLRTSDGLNAQFEVIDKNGYSPPSFPSSISDCHTDDYN